MKFNLLAVGQQFEYQGETYIKSTPLIAHQVDTGEQRLIPLSATVISTVNTPATAPVERKSVASEELRAAFAELEENLRHSFEEDTRFDQAFSQARRRFFERLELPPASTRADDHSAS